MTITEAKKIIEMCADAVKKGDGDEAKIYVNKEYVLSILDMVEIFPRLDYPDIPSFPWNPMNPGVTYTDGHWVWRKLSTGTGDDAPGEWHLVYEKGPDPYTPWCGDISGTGHQPWQPDVHVSCDDTVKFTKYANTYTSAENTSNVTITNDSTTPTHQYVEKFTTADSDNKTV